MIETREPIYHQIKRELLEELSQGKFLVGAEFYTEPMLEDRFRASRGTVRKALSDLEQDGFLSRQSGRRTSVSRLPISKHIEITALSQLMRDAKVDSTTEVLRREIIDAGNGTGRIHEGFGLDVDEPVICIRRLRMGNGTPLAIQTVYLRPQDCPDILKEDLSQSLINLYAKKYGCRLEQADEILNVVPVGSEDARILKISADTQVVIRDRISYDQKNRPFEVLHSVDRTGAFHYNYHIRRDQIGLLQTDESN